MKKYQLKSFNSVFFLLWIIIAGIIWAVDDSNYPFLFQKILSAIALLGTLIVTTHLLCNRILSGAILKNRMPLIVCWIFLMAITQSILLSLFLEGFYLLESHGILPLSENSENKELFLAEVFGFLPLTILVNLGFGGLKFYFEHAKLYEQHLILQKEHLETQLQSLQAQINPHFMFNVLNHIHILIQKDSDLASSLLIKYSDILRYQLYGSDKESVNIEDEIRFMKGYIEVERYRWENTLDFNANWQLENPKMQVPPLLLIPFIENAFKHVSRSKSQKGYISINLNQNNKELTFEVENSKSYIKRTTASNSGIGLDNVKKRLNLLYPNKHRLIINETDYVYHSKLIINLSNDGESK